MIGFAMCGSYCTHHNALRELASLRDRGYDVIPILSENVYCTDTRFGSAEELRRRVCEICGREALHTIEQTEPLGPKIKLEALIICPCTGNTLAKLANGVTDTSVTMAAKAHLRSDRPLVISLASNDAMSANLGNIGRLLNRKQIYFVPMLQDDPISKPHSLVARTELLFDTLESAMKGIQQRKLFL